MLGLLLCVGDGEETATDGTLLLNTIHTHSLRLLHHHHTRNRLRWSQSRGCLVDEVKVKQYYYYYCGSSPTRQAPLFATNSTRVDRVSRERNVSWLCGVAVCSIWRGVKKRKTLPRFSRLNASLRYNVRWGRLGDRQAGTLFWFGPANVCQ